MPLDANSTPLIRTVPILTYHSLDTSGSVISVSPQLFRWQIQSLAEQGYSAICLNHLLEGWSGRRELPKRPVVLCFDDGFENIAKYAAPSLIEFGFEATVFVVAGYVGKENNWPSQSPAAPRLPLLGWRQLHELAQGPFEVGAHSVYHHDLKTLGETELRQEVIDCQKMIEIQLGQAVTTFAYPYGRVSPYLHQVVSEYFLGACTTKLAFAEKQEDWHKMSRLDVYYLRNRAMFRRLDTILSRLYLRSRAIGRNLRQAIMLRRP